MITGFGHYYVRKCHFGHIYKIPLVGITNPYTCDTTNMREAQMPQFRLVELKIHIHQTYDFITSIKYYNYTL